MSALAKGMAKLKISAEDLWETYMTPEQKECIEVGEIKLKLGNKQKAYMRKATMTSNIIPPELNPRICKNGNCRMLLLGGVHKSCSMRSKKPIQPIIKRFSIDAIVSKSPPYHLNYVSALFIGSSGMGKSVAVASIIQTIIKLQPERYKRDTSYAFASKPEENDWSYCLKKKILASL